MHCIDAQMPDMSTQCIWALPLTEVLCYSTFEHSNAIKIRNGIMFNFYPGLPHICSINWHWQYPSFTLYVATQWYILLLLSGRESSTIMTLPVSFNAVSSWHPWTNFSVYRKPMGKSPRCSSMLMLVCRTYLRSVSCYSATSHVPYSWVAAGHAVLV